MTQEKEGVDQLIKIWDLVLEMGNVSEKFVEADTWIKKSMTLLPLTDEIAGLISLKPTLLVKEWKDFSGAERDLFYQHAAEKLDLADEAVEAKIEMGLLIVNKLVLLMTDINAYAKLIKGESV